jgi:hypothetical protein
LQRLGEAGKSGLGLGITMGPAFGLIHAVIGKVRGDAWLEKALRKELGDETYESLEKLSLSDPEAAKQLVESIKQVDLPEQQELVEKAVQGDTTATEALKDGQYREAQPTAEAEIGQTAKPGESVESVAATPTETPQGVEKSKGKVKWDSANYKTEEEARADYEKRGLKEHGESMDEFLRFMFCGGLAK